MEPFGHQQLGHEIECATVIFNLPECDSPRVACSDPASDSEKSQMQVWDQTRDGRRGSLPISPILAHHVRWTRTQFGGAALRRISLTLLDVRASPSFQTLPTNATAKLTMKQFATGSTTRGTT